MKNTPFEPANILATLQDSSLVWSKIYDTARVSSIGHGGMSTFCHILGLTLGLSS